MFKIVDTFLKRFVFEDFIVLDTDFARGNTIKIYANVKKFDQECNTRNFMNVVYDTVIIMKKSENI